jgi:hypothetical protein
MSEVTVTREDLFKWVEALEDFARDTEYPNPAYIEWRKDRLEKDLSREIMKYVSKDIQEYE